MWTCKEYTQYLHTFSRRYKLQQYIKTNVGVIYIRALEGGRWEVHLSTRDNTRWIETYDAVCICSGLHQSRNIPVWVNVKPPMRKDVSIMHSSQFNAEDVRDKNVLVIGLGESGSDISLLASRVAKSVKISFREKSGSGYVLPRYTGGEVSDLNTSRGFGRHNMWGRADYRRFAALADDAVEDEDAAALTELSRCFVGTDAFSPLDLLAIKWNAGFNNRPYDRFGTKNYSFLEAVCSYGAELVGEVSSWDDVPSDCDAVVLCTGFQARFPFFDSNSHPEVDLGANASNHRERYQHTIDLGVGPSLAFIGYSRPAFGAIPPLSEMAARYWALLLTGERTIGPSARAEAAADQAYEERLFYRDASRLPALVQYHRSMDNLAKLIGCFPPLEELRINHREIEVKMAQDIAREIVAMQASKPALAFKVKVSPAKSLLLSTSMEGREKIYHLEVKEGNGSFAWKYKTLDAVVKYIRNCGVGGRATFKLVPSEGKSGIVLAELTWDTAFKTLAAFLQDKLELLEATT